MLDSQAMYARVTLQLRSQDQLARLLEVVGLRVDKLQRNQFNDHIQATFWACDDSMAELGALMHTWRTP